MISSAVEAGMVVGGSPGRAGGEADGRTAPPSILEANELVQNR